MIITDIISANTYINQILCIKCKPKLYDYIKTFTTYFACAKNYPKQFKYINIFYI